MEKKNERKTRRLQKVFEREFNDGLKENSIRPVDHLVDLWKEIKISENPFPCETNVTRAE